MTTIAAFKNNTHVAILGDRQVTIMNDKLMLHHPKVLHYSNNLILGVAGTVQELQLISEKWNPVYVAEKGVVSVKDSLQRFVESHGIDELSSEFIVICEGEVFHMLYDFSVIQVPTYCAIGSGRDYAVGAMAVLTGSPGDVVKTAVDVAAMHDTSTGFVVSDDVITVKLDQFSIRENEPFSE